MTIPRLLLVGIASASIAWCGVITETETNGNATNNTIATAQAIPLSAFGSPAPVGIFNTNLSSVTIHGFGGGQDVDFYSFIGVGSLELSITDNPFTFPTIVSLFDSTGRLLAYDDSSDPLKPGSVSTSDSYLGTFQLPSLGTYYVAVSNANASIPSYPDSSSCTGFDVLTRRDGGFGGVTTTGCNNTSSVFSFASAQPATGSLAYTLVIGDAPEPGTLSLFGLGFCALGVGCLLRKTRGVSAAKQQGAR